MAAATLDSIRLSESTSTSDLIRNAAEDGKVSQAAGKGKIITAIQERIRSRKPFYSFEYFPPKTDAGVVNLYKRLDRMSQLQPLFMDFTWGAGGTTADLTLEISANAQNYCAPEVMMHLTCTNMPIEKVMHALEVAKKSGIRNILALRGDPPKGTDVWTKVEGGLDHAVDLVRLIRREYGDYFGIGVAGYPETHLSASSAEDDIKYLKEKLDAGADFVITQLFYDCDLFQSWVQACRAAGITKPIVPGIMPIQNYAGFKRMTGFCKTAVPQHIMDALEPIQNDDAAVRQFGIEQGVHMCRQLLAMGCPGLHFYTLNLEYSVARILEGLNFVARIDKQVALPWRRGPNCACVGPCECDLQQLHPAKRAQKEEVRPIFWSNRPDSYLSRTTTWDEFPNGRWGDARSPAFGDLSDYHLCNFRTGSVAERKAIWGENLHEMTDVYEIFARYVEGQVPRLPWCETPVHLETVPLKERLARMNRFGILTINSQPRVNGAPSDDRVVGWGGPGGYVYQKAYLEFFISPDVLRRLIDLAPSYPQLTYHAVNAAGESFTNVAKDHKGVTAVTWGVFPNKEILQPTVVDPSSFIVWKDEAFALWKSQWLAVYPKETRARAIIQEVVDTFFLVNMVDNDYVKGDIFAIFEHLMGGANGANGVANANGNGASR